MTPDIASFRGIAVDPKCYVCKFSEPTNRRSTATPLHSANNHYGSCVFHGEWKLWDATCEHWQIESSPCLEYILELNLKTDEAQLS
jgi:hypothetical protein